MKRIFTSLSLVIGISVIAHAQVVIENHVPPFGTNYSLFQITNTINQATPGANQTWDYSAAALTTVITFSIVDPAGLPASIKDSVPNADWAEKINLGTPELAPYAFYENKTTCYVKTGTKSSGSNPVEKANDTAIVFGHAYDSIIYYGMNRHYAGYGTLKVSTKTYNNVAMIKSYATGTTDTLIQFHQFLPHWQLLMSYANMNGTISNKYYWEPTASTNGMDNLSANPVSLYPNPAKDRLTIDLNQTAATAQVTVYDITGKSILQANAVQTQLLHLDLHHLVKGLYTVEVSADGKKSFNKLMLQ